MIMGNKRFILLAFVSLLAVSCYKDLSTEATHELSDIEITSDVERLDVFYGETLTFTPEVKIKGRKASEIEYKWDMTLSPQGSDYELELGTDKTLSFFVGNTPSSKPYLIRLTVTDKVTGLSRTYTWDAYIASPLGEGLLVAHTADGGQTSELSLLKAKPVTEGYTGSTRITHNLYQLANGEPIRGRVKTVSPVVSTNGSTYNLNRVFIGTETDLIALNYLDYKEDVRNGALYQFPDDVENFNIDAIMNYAGYCNAVISNGKFYNYICNSAYLFSQARYHNTPSDIITTKTLTAAKYSQGNVYLVDVNNGKFFLMMGWNPASSFQELTVNTTYELAGATPVACGIMKRGEYDKACFVLKSEGNYYATTITTNGADFSNYKLTGTAQNIDDAKGFAFCDNTDFFYYFTDRKINVVLLSGKNVTHRALDWAPESKNEKITGMYHYTQGWYGTQQIHIEEEHLIDTHKLQMIITTYDETTGEGKIYLRPFNLSTGLFTMQNNGVYGGFNEITAITTTLR